MFIYIEDRILRKTWSSYSKMPEAIRDVVGYSSNSYTKHKIDVSQLTADEVGKIKETVLEMMATDDQPHYRTLIKKIDQVSVVQSDVHGGYPVKSLDAIPAAIKAYTQQAPHGLFFKQNADGIFLPFMISECTYHRASGSKEYRTPAYVNLSVSYHVRGSTLSTSFNFYNKHKKYTSSELLALCGLYIENDEMIEDYKSALREYVNFKSSIGKQVYAIGTGQRLGTSWWGGTSQTDIEMIRDGEPTKVIIDDQSDEVEEEYKSSSGRRSSSDGKMTIDTRYLGRSPKRVLLDEDDLNVTDEEESIDETDEMIGYSPIHPHIKVFDLSTHSWLQIFSQNLMEYPWNKGLMDKLILPEDQKELITMLMETTKVKHDDIIKGKMQGVIVLATGAPGVGKTLTAEIFSEFIERPLYSVQCSQLGLDVESIEKNLSTALKRAARWGAILLIDEADVYIHERGDDITQNAIVGVFLRLIEYYQGIMFMTSNRGDFIDDAIMSRSTAWIQYLAPDNELLRKIWSVLGSNYGAKFTDEQLDDLVTTLPNITGRTVRNILKLAALLASKNETDITPEDIKRVSRYQKLD